MSYSDLALSIMLGIGLAAATGFRVFLPMLIVSVAAQAVKRIVDRFCNGSLEELLLGLVDHAVLDRRRPSARRPPWRADQRRRQR